jgi:2,4-dienoyl-CoA reductase-like NADH-dependent reductase (Old Yellow Enzyme family)
VTVRFSATDWADGGWDEEQTATVARWAAERGAAFFDVSSGGLVAHQKIVTGPGYQVPQATAVRRDGEVAVGAVGEITSGPQAEADPRGGRGRRDPRGPRVAARPALRPSRLGRAR